MIARQVPNGAVQRDGAGLRSDATREHESEVGDRRGCAFALIEGDEANVDSSQRRSDTKARNEALLSRPAAGQVYARWATTLSGLR
jgi:hypothetical protein